MRKKRAKQLKERLIADAKEKGIALTEHSTTYYHRQLKKAHTKGKL